MPGAGPPDPFEPDNTCSSANAIVPDGTTQNHTFHAAGDLDWVRFQATAGVRYVITGRHTGPLADIMTGLYNGCNDPNPVQDDDFGNDTILTWTAPATGVYYLRLANHDANAFGPQASYQISVRSVSTGVAIIAGGRLHPTEQLQRQITYMTNRAYQVFYGAGYDHDAIYYLSADPATPLYMDAPSLNGTLQYALAAWAPARIQDSDPLYLYLTDHGDPDLFYVDTGNQVATTAQLENWLLAFESQRPNSPVVIIVEACYSGSFITPPYSLARQGRVVVTATGDANLSYARPVGQGAYFSDAFFDALGQSYSVWDSYQLARQAVSAAQGNRQTPWIDGDGDGVPYPLDGDDAGAGRHLGLGRPAGFTGQAPYIEQPAMPLPAGVQPVRIAVQVLDEHRPSTAVWAMVSRPSTPPPSAPPGYTTPVSHAERVDLVYSVQTDRFEVDFIFDEAGVYQWEFNARDASGQQALPVTVTVRTAAEVYLPLIVR